MNYFSLSPFFTGRDERSSLLEGRGEGLSQSADSRRIPLTRNSLSRISTSPRKRGEVKEASAFGSKPQATVTAMENSAPHP